MIVKEKQEKIYRYCGNTNCGKCVLRNGNWDNVAKNIPHKCLNIEKATETELDRALALISAESRATLNEKREVVELDPIKPDYYNDSMITPINVIDDWGLNFYLGSAIKYIKRAGKKADNSRLQDLKKVRAYIDHEIKAEEESK